MNIDEVKASLGYSSLQLNTANDKDGNPTAWFRHWDNTNRIAVSIHSDTLDKIDADRSIDTLALQSEVRTGEQGDYTAKRIVMYTPAERTL